VKGYYKLVIVQPDAHSDRFLRTGKDTHEAWTNGTHIQTISRNISSCHMADAIIN